MFVLRLDLIGCGICALWCSVRILTVLDKFTEHYPAGEITNEVGVSHATSPGVHVAIQDSVSEFNSLTHFSALYSEADSNWKAEVTSEHNKPLEQKHNKLKSAEIFLPSSAVKKSFCLEKSSPSCVRRVAFSTFALGSFFQQATGKTAELQSLIVSAKLFNWSSVQLANDALIVFSKPTNQSLVSSSSWLIRTDIRVMSFPGSNIWHC